MELNKMELIKLMELLKNNNGIKLTEDLVNQISDYYGVLMEDQTEIEWLQFIINNYA